MDIQPAGEYYGLGVFSSKPIDHGSANVIFERLLHSIIVHCKSMGSIEVKLHKINRRIIMNDS